MPTIHSTIPLIQEQEVQHQYQHDDLVVVYPVLPQVANLRHAGGGSVISSSSSYLRKDQAGGNAPGFYYSEHLSRRQHHQEQDSSSSSSIIFVVGDDEEDVHVRSIQEMAEDPSSGEIGKTTPSTIALCSFLLAPTGDVDLSTSCSSDHQEQQSSDEAAKLLRLKNQDDHQEVSQDATEQGCLFSCQYYFSSSSQEEEPISASPSSSSVEDVSCCLLLNEASKAADRLAAIDDRAMDLFLLSWLKDPAQSEATVCDLNCSSRR